MSLDFAHGRQNPLVPNPAAGDLLGDHPLALGGQAPLTRRTSVPFKEAEDQGGRAGQQRQ
jgi:hypothetical protein